MSRGWAERHGATEPAAVGQNETNHAVNNANGTGPFSVASWEPGIRLVLNRNPGWWGWGAWPGNLDRAVLTPIASPATRVAGLLSGELDMVSPVPMQDAERIRTNPSTRLVAGHEARVVYLGLDVRRDQLLHGGVPGRNPFKDVRVRQAIAHAVNIDGLNRVVFRGLAAPAAMIVPEGVSGYDPAARRPAFDLGRARALMREAGFAEGFSVTLDCPAGREVGDRDACEALVNLLARISIRGELLAQPPARWAPKVAERDTSLYYMSWGNNGWAGGNTLHDLLSCAEAERPRGFNSGGYCNPALDAVVGRARQEVQPERHRALLREAFAIVQADMPVIPLYMPPILWGTREGITVRLRPDGRVFLPHVVMR
jgi:peptide/nickel transport system substrate-binding protein